MPKVGLGKLFGEKKTVIRTGYQIGYDSFFNNIASNAAVSHSQRHLYFGEQPSHCGDPARPRATGPTSLPQVPRAPIPGDSQTLIIKNLVNPYYQRWSFGIQRELPANLLLDVSYVGSKGSKLFANEDFNPLVPASLRITPANTSSAAVLQGRYDNLQGSRLTRTNGGDSNYESLQVSLDRRFSAGTCWSEWPIALPRTSTTPMTSLQSPTATHRRTRRCHPSTAACMPTAPCLNWIAPTGPSSVTFTDSRG